MLASSAFLASAANTHDLQKQILFRCDPCPDAAFTSACSVCSSTHNLPCRSPPFSSKQKAWDTPFIEIDKNIVLSGAQDNHHRARVLAVCARHARDWLHSSPISSYGLRLDNEMIRVAVGLRLGVNLCQPHPCPCGTQVDARGTQGMACKQSTGRIARHHHINGLIYRGLSLAGVPST